MSHDENDSGYALKYFLFPSMMIAAVFGYTRSVLPKDKKNSTPLRDLERCATLICASFKACATRGGKDNITVFYYCALAPPGKIGSSGIARDDGNPEEMLCALDVEIGKVPEMQLP